MLTRRERAVAFLGTTATEPSALKTLRAGFTRIAAQLGTPTGIHHCLLRVKQPFLCFSYSSSGFDTSVPCWHPCTVTPGSQHPRVSGGGAPAENRAPACPPPGTVPSIMSHLGEEKQAKSRSRCRHCDSPWEERAWNRNNKIEGRRRAMQFTFNKPAAIRRQNTLQLLLSSLCSPHEGKSQPKT